ncbi:hypothetical protein LTR10_006725 [Elasticomyces elasticus]|nr:hypothetical protein LTR10_006725 [Elasticomyces elasticus]KAK4972874.1 hypothetical protein LTR42_006168 [Elasticomyces elasticus]
MATYNFDTTVVSFGAKGLEAFSLGQKFTSKPLASLPVPDFSKVQFDIAVSSPCLEALFALPPSFEPLSLPAAGFEPLLKQAEQQSVSVSEDTSYERQDSIMAPDDEDSRPAKRAKIA